ncbi:MAG: copper amine oxidase N-terminal domain-containing protein, partial [Armatimonadetes bacterium]|nr:copper amine oxidase N-terminal domain-containing protein [Armatimonadota bacterium]
MRSRLAIWLCVAVLLGSAAWAAPAPPGPPVSVSVDGMPAPLSVPPVEKDGQWMAPSPDIFKYLGAVANYDNLTRTVKAIRGKTVILMKVGSTTARVNLKPQMLEVAPFLSGDRVMVPLRFVAATLGAQVAYDAPSRVIHLKTGKSTAVVVPPPPAPSPTPTPAPTPAPVQTGGPPAIREFYHNAQGALKPGDSLVVTLLGTPNGKASFFIEGVVEDVPLRESSPGTYSADYRFAGTGRIRGAKLYGTLMVGKDRAPLAVAAAPITVEPPRPHVQQAEPAPNSATSVSTPRIAGFFEPAGGILDPKTVVIRVNGTDVTSKAYVTQKFFTYTPQTPLPAGKVRVDVEARLTGAEPLQDTWQFDIQSGVSIASATHGAQAVYGPGETITVTMMGTSGGKATYDLGSYRVGLPMRETGTPGNYVGTYNVTSSDRADNIPI